MNIESHRHFVKELETQRRVKQRRAEQVSMRLVDSINSRIGSLFELLKKDAPVEAEPTDARH